MSTNINVERPTSGDVIDLIIDDHRLFEAMLRDMRDASKDRDAVRQSFAAVLIAHGEAEESLVYPVLRRRSEDVSSHDVEHGNKEHAEGNQALLKLLEVKDSGSKEFDDAVEELSNMVYHHVTEEEITILSPAREEVAEHTRADLGERWAARRNELIDEDCGSVENVRRIVKRAEEEGYLEK